MTDPEIKEDQEIGIGKTEIEIEIKIEGLEKEELSNKNNPF